MHAQFERLYEWILNILKNNHFHHCENLDSLKILSVETDCMCKAERNYMTKK